jgi:transposase
VTEEKINDDRLYRAHDALLPLNDVLKGHLKERFGTLFGLEYDLLLYDVTSTYFEGLTADAELAKRGYSRDHRSDCLQVCIGLVVTRDGFPLGHEVVAGNRHDSTTLRGVVERMESQYGRLNRNWAVDRAASRRRLAPRASKFGFFNGLLLASSLLTNEDTHLEIR